MIYTLAKKLSERVALLLFFARLNAIGLGITVIQLLYLWLKDDDLQNWLEKCTFRKEKIAESALTKYSFSAVRLTYSTETYPSLQKELEEMNMAFAEVTGQTVETPGKEEESSNEPDDHLWNPN